jgi:hypothetical protein
MINMILMIASLTVLVAAWNIIISRKSCAVKKRKSPSQKSRAVQ